MSDLIREVFERHCPMPKALVFNAGLNRYEGGVYTNAISYNDMWCAWQHAWLAALQHTPQPIAEIFPHHACGLYLEHNSYKDVYDSIQDAVERKDAEEWTSLDEKQKAMDTEEIWTLQWYPNTPVGFYRISASSLDALLLAAKENNNE
jgi:hypothetical protein